jgi:hypothetical protein
MGKGYKPANKRKPKMMFLQFKIRKYSFFNGHLRSTIKANEKNQNGKL